MKENPQNFEKSLKRLEEILHSLEGGDVTLSQSLDLFEEGMKEARLCQQFLDEAKERIQVLKEDGYGNITASPFSPSSLEEEGE